MTAKTTGTTTTIHERLCRIMEEVKAIGKDSKNTSQGFSFRGIDAVMNGLHPIFSKHGVIIAPEVLEERSEDRTTQKGAHLIYRIAKIRYHFIGADGDEVCSTVMGEGMDSGDKGMNKAMAVALKYALTQMLLLPYDEVDPDSESHPDSTPTKARQSIQPTTPIREAPTASASAQVASDASEPPPEDNVIFIDALPAVGTKPGTTKGKAWIRGYIKVGDFFYSTFSESMIEQLRSHEGESVEILFGETNMKNSRDIIDIKYEAVDDRPF